jgi:hypothetical protein
METTMTETASWEEDIEGETEAERWRGLTLHRGQFILNRVVRRIDKPDFSVWEIDCRSKYPDAWTASSLGDHWEVHVHIEQYEGDVRSLHLADTEVLTVIHVPGTWERLHVYARRYTIEIIAWNYPKDQDD